MARKFTQITTSIWNDDDFRALTARQQALYFMLDTQGLISAAGTLALTVRRWSRNATDWTPELIEEELTVLAEKGHVVVDDETEELLIVKFVKWDGGWKNTTKRLPVIREAAMAIESPAIRDALAKELVKLGLSDMASELARDRASDSQPDTASAFDRVVVKEGELDSQPLTGNLEREPLGDAEPPSPFCSKHPKGTEKPCGPCGTAKLRHAAWVKSRPHREAAARADAERRKAAAADCPSCGGSGWIEDAAGNPVEKCTHLRVSA